MSITKEKKKSIIKSFRNHENDTGSSEVQIAILTERIGNLTEHLKAHKKDKHSRLGLIKIISQRRRLINYLSRVNSEVYTSIIGRLKIRK